MGWFWTNILAKNIDIQKNMNRNKLLIFVLFLLLFILSTSVHASAEQSNYYIDISLFPEGYAEFKLNVIDHTDLNGILIELPMPKCEDNLTNLSDLRKNLRVSDIPDEQTLEGKIELEKSCMGIGITKPKNTLKNFTFSFTYEDFNWELHPEKYPFDYYNMPILISFPKIRTENSALVSTKILLPLNTEAKNISAYRLWEHPSNTQSDFSKIDLTH